MKDFFFLRILYILLFSEILTTKTNFQEIKLVNINNIVEEPMYITKAKKNYE